MLYQIFFLFLVPLTISFYLSKEDKKQIGFSLFAFYCVTLVLNLLFFCITGKSMLNFIKFSNELNVLYVVGCILIGFISHKIWYHRSTYKIPIYKFLTLITMILLSNIIIYFLWLLGTTGRMSFELFYLNITSSVNTTASGFYDTISILGSVMLLSSIAVIYIIFKSEKFLFLKIRKWKKQSKLQMLNSFLCLVFCYAIMLWLPFYSFHLEKAYDFFHSESDFIEKHYIDPNTVELTWPETKRNLLLVFAESFESSYFSKDLGGMMDVNLLPNFTALMDEGIYFTGNENGFGGAISMPQATNTISGMATTLTGINYKRPPDTAYNDFANTIPGSTNLNDILKKEGYELYYMLGTNLVDYNIGAYYQQHGNTTTIGYEDKIASGELPADYKVWWGFEDSKLYAFAKEDLTELGSKTEPFMYVMSTDDIHSPGGYTDPTCSSPYDIPMKNAIACTDSMMTDFLRWVMEQPFYENTTVVVVGDHIAHSDELIDSITPVEDRRVFNLFLNAASPQKEGVNNTRAFWAGDMFPTMLSALGVDIKGNRLALGANLFSVEPTLIEIYGEDSVRNSLEKNSEFYYTNFSTLPE